MTWCRHLTMGEVRRGLAAGQIDPTEFTAWPWSVLAAEGDPGRSLTWVAPPPTRGELPGPERPLAGFAAVRKANICAQGEPTDCASRLLRGWRAPYDATVCARLRAAGAELAGAGNMDEFGMGSTGEHSAWGPTLNPWDGRRAPGGSSSGPAAAVASGLAWYALGSDTGGSVRLPAHCCGVVGLKPTWGRISRYGLVAFASSCDTVGVLARDVADAAAVYAAVAGPDPRDTTCAERSLGDPERAVARAARGTVVGVPRALIAAHAEPAVARDLDEVLADLAHGGVTVREVVLPGAADALAAYAVLAAAEAASNLARYDGALYGRRGAGDDYAAMVRSTRGNGFGPEVRRRVLLGTHVLTGDDQERTLLRARAVRERLRAAFRTVFAEVDALALPTAPEPAVLLGSRLDDPVAMYRSDVFTVPASLAGLPAVTVPTSCTADGLPLSVQFVGPAWGEETVLGLGAAVERERRFRARKEAPWHQKA